MAANIRLEHLENYKGVLPYASELFGVYQPLIGWKSKRRLDKIRETARVELNPTIDELKKHFRGSVDVTFDDDHQFKSAALSVGGRIMPEPRVTNGSILLAMVQQKLLGSWFNPPRQEQWKEALSDDGLQKVLSEEVIPYYRGQYQARYREVLQSGSVDFLTLQDIIREEMRSESAMAGMLSTMVDKQLYSHLEATFYTVREVEGSVSSAIAQMRDTFDDPFLTFDPTKSVKGVTLSPIGIVHLYRQFFFELDSFLGTPVGHVWLSPGSTVELLEVSTRRTLVEKTIETGLETTSKSERSNTDEDEISDAVRQDNRADMKLGFSTTVNQSWGTGSATATGSLDLSNTQDTAREQQHKRSRQQAEKLTSEIKQNFKSTFKTVTETTDTSSKRYVLNNVGTELLNYELRRKMRQVAVQIQDIGSYLCWETFVDQPGKQLALPNLIHIAKPADLVLVPNPKEMPMPPLTIGIGFTGEAVWNFPSNARQNNASHPETGKQFVPIGTIDIPGIPPDYTVAYDPANPYIEVEKQVIAAEDDDSWNAVNWGFKGMIMPGGTRVMVGVVTGPGGLAWDDRITFRVRGGVTCQLNKSKQDEVASANQALMSAKQAADVENQKRLEKAYLDAASERVTLASKVTKRKFETLREEERTIVYRNLIKSLLSESVYRNLPDTPSGFHSRHVLSELLNAIFDIDKMLYFVAPEWWKPRAVAQLKMAGKGVQDLINGSVINWTTDAEYSKYFITEHSDPAPLGSSLGWLQQLDGDDLRNAFLNSPWVKAVIPIRPGKEAAAINWLKNVGVEGAHGLDMKYAAPDAELDRIKAELLAADPNDPVGSHPQVTIDDAVRHLCLTVAKKHEQSNTVGRYPPDEPDDKDRVSSTPVEKVYEHGFYPLVGGFKARTEAPFEVFSQWVEVLPTDQVVPVQVKYNPKTGRQE